MLSKKNKIKTLFPMAGNVEEFINEFDKNKFIIRIDGMPMIEKITYAREKLSINIIDVQYKDLITNQKNTIQYLVERCRVEISILPDLIGNQNVRQLKSKVIYNSPKQEIDPDHVHRQFGDYMDRFQILKEV